MLETESSIVPAHDMLWYLCKMLTMLFQQVCYKLANMSTLRITTVAEWGHTEKKSKYAHKSFHVRM